MEEIQTQLLGPGAQAARRPAVARLTARSFAARKEPDPRQPIASLLIIILLFGAAIGISALIWRKAEGPKIAANAPMLKIERLLETLNFPPGHVDGVFDTETESAIRTFQEAAGLAIDGKPSQPLLDELIAVTGENN